MKIDYSEIDFSLRELIFLLNKKGFETTSCCSGISTDHSKDYKWIGEEVKRGYITFKDLSENQKKEIVAISRECGLRFVDDFINPIYSFNSILSNYDVKDYLSLGSCIENFIPIINIRDEDGYVRPIEKIELRNGIDDIVINDRWKKFIDLIRPHIIDSMKYKKGVKKK